MAGILSVEAILASDDRTVTEVEVPEWGGSVKVQAFSKRQSSDIRKSASNPSGEIDSDALEKQLFLQGVIEPQFSEEQYNLLLEKSAVALDRVVKAVLNVSGMGEGAVKESEANFPS